MRQSSSDFLKKHKITKDITVSEVDTCQDIVCEKRWSQLFFFLHHNPLNFVEEVKQNLIL